MKLQNVIILISACIFYITNSSNAMSCCWGSNYDEFYEEVDSQPNFVTRKLVDHAPPLKRYAVDVTQYTNAKTTPFQFIETQSGYKHIGAIIGRDDRVPVANVQDRLWRPHGHLDMIFPNKESYIGSGTVIYPHHVLTAAHCVYGKDEGGWATSMTFSPAQQAGNNPFGQAQVTQIFVMSEWIKSQDPKYDFALLVTDKDIGYQTGWYGLMSPDDRFLSSLDINVTGYPGDKGRGHQMYTMPGKPKSIFPERFTYTIDTNKGQSGAAVWATLKDGGRYCCGIHTNGLTNVENTATRISSTKFDLLVSWMKQS